MGKKYDAERVRKFIDNLHSQLDTYDSGARIVESNYKRYIGNDKYLGVAADASKQYVSVKQMMFHKEQDTIHDKIYRLYCDIETTFIDTVDSSPKARIDTDELGIIKTDHTGYYKALDKEGYGVEDKVREIQSALEGYWSFTQPDYNPARQSYIKFCGNGKFLDDCVKKVEQFDQDSWDYVNRSGLEEYVYELTDDIKQTASALNATRVYDPQMDDVFLGLVTHGGKYVKDFLLHKDTVDEFLYTGDQKLDAIINAFMVFDATTGRYEIGRAHV